MKDNKRERKKGRKKKDYKKEREKENNEKESTNKHDCQANRMACLTWVLETAPLNIDSLSKS